jgi:hypothetical protein
MHGAGHGAVRRARAERQTIQPARCACMLRAGRACDALALLRGHAIQALVVGRGVAVKGGLHIIVRAVYLVRQHCAGATGPLRHRTARLPCALHARAALQPTPHRTSARAWPGAQAGTSCRARSGAPGEVGSRPAACALCQVQSGEAGRRGGGRPAAEAGGRAAGRSDRRAAPGSTATGASSGFRGCTGARCIASKLSCASAALLTPHPRA